jgi:hypothetical protein
MLHIHHTSCISPQQTFPHADLDTLHESVNNKMLVIEPVYQNIPPSMLRRMGKAVKISIGSSLPLLQGKEIPDGIIIGSGNGGMEDCIKFLNQIIDYEEGLLTPGHFVQSTTNAMASQISLLTGNKSYNMTHVHLGLAFENALLDTMLQQLDNPGARFLLGGVDEISSSNFNIEFQDGWYKREPLTNKNLFAGNSAGSMAGEGAAMFLVDGNPRGSLGSFRGLSMVHSEDLDEVAFRTQGLLNEKLGDAGKVDLLITGENGDNRLTPSYHAMEARFGPNTTVLRFKHMTGEFPTATAIACWLATRFLQGESIPGHMIKKQGGRHQPENIFIYNNFKGKQHSMILLSKS